MRRSRTIIALALLLIGALLLGGWLVDRFQADRGAQEIVFPDGTRAKFLGVVRSGTQFSTEKAWAGPLRRILPVSWQRWLPAFARINCSGVNTNDIVVYFGLDKTTSGGALPWSSLAAEDNDGFRYPASGGSCSTSSDGMSVHGVIVAGFPRRQKNFRLNFLNSDYQIIAHLRLANPLPVPPPEQNWSSEPMPITRTNGELALTLVSAREGTNSWGAHFRPKWDAKALDARWKHTQPGHLQISDATGNEGGFLSRKERVWRVASNFHRKRNEDFSAEEKLILTNLPVPVPGEMITPGIAQDCADVRVQFEGVFGAGTLFITNGLQRVMTTNLEAGWSTTSNGRTTVEQIASKSHFLLVNTTGMGAHDELRIQLADEQGREISLEQGNGYRYRNGTNTRQYQRSFELTNAVQSLSVEIIVSRSLEFVFYINPADIAAPEPKPNTAR